MTEHSPQTKQQVPPAVSAALASGQSRFYATEEQTASQATPHSSAFFAAGEAQVTGQKYQPSPEEVKRRGKRNLAIALGIVGFIVLVYSITLLRISQNVPGAF